MAWTFATSRRCSQISRRHKRYWDIADVSTGSTYDSTEAEASVLAAVTFSNALLVPVEAERSSFRELTAAFRTNLTALGLLALVVGSFLIYGTMTFAVLQRTSTLGVLRALGVSRGEMVRSVLWEAGTIAVAATALGLVFGHVLAIGLVELVLRTIGDLSFGRAVAVTRPSPWIYAQGVALGLGATLLAAAKPALDAARAAPAVALRRAALERRARAGARRAVPLAVALLAASGLTLAFGPSDLYLAFAALFGVLAAGGLLTPTMTVALMRGIDRVVGRRFGLPVTLAIRGVGASLSRTGVATAALAIAVATVNGVGLMIVSFRTSLDAWLDTTLTADVYVSSADGALLAELAESGQLAAIPGVESVALTRARMLPTPRGDLAIRAVAPGDRGFGLAVVAGDPEASLAELAGGRAVLVSERLLLARGLVVGDELELPAPSGPVRLPIAGAFRDFNTGEPSVVMALARYRRDWQDTDLTGHRRRHRGRFRPRECRGRATRSAARARRPGSFQRRDQAHIARDIRPDLQGHGGLANSRRHRRVSRDPERATRDRARAGARAQRSANDRLHAAKPTGDAAHTNGVARTGGWTRGHTDRHCPCTAVGRRDQQPLVRLEHGLRRDPGSLGIRVTARDRRGVAGRRLPGMAREPPRARSCASGRMMRSRFLLLSALLSLAACGKSPQEVVAERPSNTGLRYLGGSAESGFARATEPREFVFPQTMRAIPSIDRSGGTSPAISRRRPSGISASSSRSSGSLPRLPRRSVTPTPPGAASRSGWRISQSRTRRGDASSRENGFRARHWI